MTLPAFPSVSPDPEIAHNYASNLDLTLSPISSDGYDAYSISKLYDPSPTNAWVVANRIPAVNSPADGYVTGSLFVMPSSELPVSGFETYYIYAYRFTAGGGDAQYYYSSSFAIIRQVAPSTGYGLQIFDSSGVKKVDISSALIAVAGIDSVTIAANSSIQVNIAELNNSGVWKVFLDGFPYSGSNPIYTSVINPSVAYFNGYYTLTNNSTTYSWAGTAFVYRVS